ncbi:hypothetical protein [Candidatus Protochlamydia phocaeensis]|uniref:hypothetical protein n=1 Tax=Candidatus Protochlamydia phocaeensis TaxID=1414722 RepID=UPI0008385315|nr:hypothetical protein [Candidatus Protochlamydia phocaeensis]
MPNRSEEDGIGEIEANLKTFQTQWQEILDELAELKEDNGKDDLFATIDYLALCDQQSKMINDGLKDIDEELKALSHLRKQPDQGSKQFEAIHRLCQEFEKLKDHMRKRRQSIEEEYPILADETLRGCQDLITRYSVSMNQERNVPNLKTDINQNLDKESLLEELRDSLENYRQAREDLVEDPVEDPILSQLDTAITACDTALLIKETGD